MYSGRSPSCTQDLYQKVEDGCPKCRCIRRMAVRTLNGSAIQARLRGCFINRGTRQKHGIQKIFSRSTVLLKSSSRCTCIVSFPGSSSRGTSFVMHFCCGFSKKLQHMQRDLPSLQQRLAREHPGAKDHSRWRHQSNVRCMIREDVE